MRLDKFVSTYGFCTRAEAKKYIKSGRVRRNDNIMKNPEEKINETLDCITLDGKALLYEEKYYLMMNKPAGVVCSAHEKGQKSVMELIHEPFAKQLFPIGRLDKDTEGLLLFTNDGELSHALLSPARHVTKTYYTILKEPVSENDVIAFREGLDIGDEKLTLPAGLRIASKPCHAYVEIQEGRFHQIKRMFEKCNNQVLYLKRIKMKDLLLDESLAPGEYRRLREEEIMSLKEGKGKNI
ncbi:MAG: pseudouridine synthase [Lachnospiraceae bacterium]